MIKKDLFGVINDSVEVYSYTLSNDSITSCRIIDFGGCVVNLWVKDKKGSVSDVVCGFDTIEGYLNAGGCQGALIGRVCNRIKDGRFTLNGTEYNLFKNDGNNTLHGGDVGFNMKMWTVSRLDDGDSPSIELTYLSLDMEENFPGNLTVKVTYTLTSEGALSISYVATTDADTIVNLTNHSYFNLAGYDSGTICDQIMWIDADKINAVDDELIPTGEFINVSNTPYDFRIEKPLGRDFNANDVMVRQGGGYDTNFVLNGNSTNELKRSASLYDPASGRKMEVFTNQPCVQIYTANMIDEEDVPFKNNVPQKKYCAVCFETQKMPDSINHPGFDNTILKKDEVYDYTTVYSFSNI